jgi:hypothetical protein
MKNKYNITHYIVDIKDPIRKGILEHSFITKLRFHKEIYYSRFIFYRYYGIKLIKNEKPLHNKCK